MTQFFEGYFLDVIGCVFVCVMDEFLSSLGVHWEKSASTRVASSTITTLAWGEEGLSTKSRDDEKEQINQAAFKNAMCVSLAVAWRCLERAT